MTPELSQRLNPKLDAALTEEDAQALVDSMRPVCGNDEGLIPLKEPKGSEVNKPDLIESKLPHPTDPPNLNQNRFQPGELILDRFRIVRPIGKGGMDEVYEAEDLQLGKVAIKTICCDAAELSAALERFRREVRLARRITGPQICRVHELHLVPASDALEATAFLTMEYLDGITLSDKLRRDGPFPSKQAVNIALEICEGLRLMHEQHVVHRDLKSDNIMLCEQDGVLRVVLMDFGLAREFHSNPDAPGDVKHLRRDISGKPEQHELKPISPATDIYALGSVLYLLMAGTYPGSANSSVGENSSGINSEFVRPAPRPMVPRKFDRIIERCLENNPDKRFQSAAEVAVTLRLASSNLDNLKRDRSWIIWTMSVLTIASITGGIYSLWLSRLYYRINEATESRPRYRELFSWMLAVLLLVLLGWIGAVHLKLH